MFYIWCILYRFMYLIFIMLLFWNIFIVELSEEMKCQRYASKRCACVQQSEAELMVMHPSIQGISKLCLYNPFNIIWPCTVTVYNIMKLELARDSMSKIFDSNVYHPFHILTISFIQNHVQKYITISWRNHKTEPIHQNFM